VVPSAAPCSSTDLFGPRGIFLFSGAKRVNTPAEVGGDLGRGGPLFVDHHRAVGFQNDPGSLGVWRFLACAN
jgi:hypothetical protein